MCFFIVQANINKFLLIDYDSSEEDADSNSTYEKKRKVEEVPSTPSKEIKRAGTSEGKGKSKESPPSKKGGDSVSEDEGHPDPFALSDTPEGSVDFD